MRRLRLGLFLISSLPDQVLGDLFNLAKLDWTLRNQNGTIIIPATIPSHSHLDLARAGVITEPLLGINDFTQRWVIADNWTYTADVTPYLRTVDQWSSPTTLLVFYGIDTIANITLAGHPIAWVNNQFRQHVFDVSEFLPSVYDTDKNLTIALESALSYGQNVSSRPDAESFPGSNGDFEIPGIRYWIRKIPDDFGWDWGPALVPSGIHKPAYFVTLPADSNGRFDTTTPPLSPPVSGDSVAANGPVFIEETSIDIFKEGQSFSTLPKQDADWIVNVSLALRSATAFPTPSLIFALPELGLTSDTYSLSPLEGRTGVWWINANWRIPDGLPERWYPHNLGTPKLYNLTISLNLTSTAENIVSFTTRTGFRTIQLVQSPYSKQQVTERGITPGDNWHFEINGKAFYSLGTNIIPFDPFYARITNDQVRWVLESAVLSGQNMVTIRVWGGGTYQPSDSLVAGGVYDFYSVCDELGILAWSEFIFSDALYPINDFMLDNIGPEARQNVRRINRHPSNVQWAGGNEIEGIVTATNTSVENGLHYLNEFVTLFQHFLHDIVMSETKSVPYTDCSTTKGVLSLDPYVLRFNNGTPGDIYGNGERYNYDASQSFNYSTFPSSRFMNEFGHHSMPSFYSWEDVLTSPEDFSFNSTVVVSRDHHPPPGGLAFPNPNAPEGQAEMTSAVELWLPTPSTSDSNQTFAQWCWSTQIFQTMTMMLQIAWYRRGAGRGENNLGALVWQLNDIWQGVSWSSIEYSGRWKVLQYGMAAAFAPVTIHPFWTPDNETLEVVVTSDRWYTVTGTAQLTWYDWHGRTLNSYTHHFTVPTLNNSLILAAKGLRNVLPLGKAASDVWMLLNTTSNVDGRRITNEQYFTPVSLAKASLVDPKIKVTRNDDLTFTLSAKGGVAPWTWIDHPRGTIGYFVDNATGVPSNGFYLVPGIDHTVRFVRNIALSTISNPSPEDFVVRSLWNNTHL